MKEDSALTPIEIPEEFSCPISSQLFYYPMTASDGHTYEKEKLEELFARAEKNGAAMSPITRKPLNKEIQIENASMRSQVRGFVSKLSVANRKKLYAEDEIYLPSSMKQRLATAIKSGDMGDLKICLDAESDPRLRTVALDASGNDCVSLACDQSNPMVLTFIIGKLTENERQELLKANDLAHQRLHALVVNMQLQGLITWHSALGLEEFSFFANCAFFAVVRNDLTLLQNSLKKISIDLTKGQESQNLLHQLVAAFTSDTPIDESSLAQDRLPMIRYLIAANINTKLQNAQGLTPYELAQKLNFPYLAEQIKKEYWEHKHRTTLAPMKSTIELLAQENSKLKIDKANLEAALVSQNTRTEVLERSQ